MPLGAYIHTWCASVQQGLHALQRPQGCVCNWGPAG